MERVVSEWKSVRPDLDFSPITVFARLYLAGRLAERFYEASVAPYGLSSPDFFVLCELRRAGPPWRLSPTDLFRTLIRSSGGMTKQLDKLAADGLITRLADARDRRKLLVELTPRGLDLVDRALTHHIANEEAVLAGLSRAQLADLVVSLQTVIDRLHQEQAGTAHRDP